MPVLPGELGQVDVDGAAAERQLRIDSRCAWDRRSASCKSSRVKRWQTVTAVVVGDGPSPGGGAAAHVFKK